MSTIPMYLSFFTCAIAFTGFVNTQNLGVASSFAVIGASEVTNTGTTLLNGNLGLTPGSSLTGFPPGVVTGVKHIDDSVALTAKNAAQTAYNTASQLPHQHTLTGTNLAGLTLVAGTYFFANTASLDGTLTLDAQGNANAKWVFQIGSGLTTGSGSSVVLINSGRACQVFWQVGSSATLGSTTTFLGNVVALTSISAKTGATSNGILAALNGAVTLDSNTVVPQGLCSPVVSTGSATSSTSSSTASSTILAIPLTSTLPALSGSTMSPSLLPTSPQIAVSPGSVPAPTGITSPPGSAPPPAVVAPGPAPFGAAPGSAPNVAAPGPAPNAAAAGPAPNAAAAGPAPNAAAAGPAPNAAAAGPAPNAAAPGPAPNAAAPGAALSPNAAPGSVQLPNAAAPGSPPLPNSAAPGSIAPFVASPLGLAQPPIPVPGLAQPQIGASQQGSPSNSTTISPAGSNTLLMPGNSTSMPLSSNSSTVSPGTNQYLSSDTNTSVAPQLVSHPNAQAAGSHQNIVTLIHAAQETFTATCLSVPTTITSFRQTFTIESPGVTVLTCSPTLTTELAVVITTSCPSVPTTITTQEETFTITKVGIQTLTCTKCATPMRTVLATSIENAAAPTASPVVQLPIASVAPVVLTRVIDVPTATCSLTCTKCANPPSTAVLTVTETVTDSSCSQTVNPPVASSAPVEFSSTARINTARSTSAAQIASSQPVASTTSAPEVFTGSAHLNRPTTSAFIFGLLITFAYYLV